MFDIDPKKVSKKLQNFITSTCRQEKCTDVLIAVSGGIDSATSLALSVNALGKTHVHPVLLPYGKLSDEGTKDAKLVIKSLGITSKQVHTIDIKPFVDHILRYDTSMDGINSGNIMARMRMVFLYDLSRKYNYLVVGTENKTEHLLGYYTRFGDEASDIEPLRELYKTQVFMLAKHLKVPEKIVTKSPTAGLWEGQTDEGEFGFSYKLADEILFLLTEKKLSKKELTKKYNKKLIEKVWWWIEKGKFKDRLPYTP